MQFQVPQFIEIEDKIFGPLTLREFLYLAIAGGLCFILFFVLQTWLWVIVTVIIGTLACALAFIKFNGRPLIHTILAGFSYLWQPKFYVWKRADMGPELPTISRIPKQEEGPSQLKHLWLKMNTTTEAIENREKASTFFSFFKKPTEVLEKYEVFKHETGDAELRKRVDYR